MPPSNWLKGVVKSVLSGDTVVVMGIPRGGPPPEKQISLASIKAPRLVRVFRLNFNDFLSAAHLDYHFSNSELRLLF